MTRVTVRCEGDCAEATRVAREQALAAGLRSADAVGVATAVSEVVQNQLRHAGGGEIRIWRRASSVEVEARDRGPGIADLSLALRDGWSSVGSLGMGLPGARRLMDDFAVESSARGTIVRMSKRTRGGA